VIAVVGASGRTGGAVCQALHAARRCFLPVLRNPTRWSGDPPPRVADLRDPARLRVALAGADTIISGAHARFTPAILAAAPPNARLVLLGSTRRFSHWSDAHRDAVRDGEAAFLASGRAGVMLHPTMIYGAQGEDNVQRLAALLRRLPFAPLPNGGRALVQPIHQDDVVRCVLAALDRPWTAPQIVVIAGPEPVAYRDFLRAVAVAAGQRPPPVLSVPAAPLRWLAPLTRLLPGVPRIRADEIRRLTEDKAFDIGPMRCILGLEPIPLTTGLARTFATVDPAGQQTK